MSFCTGFCLYGKMNLTDYIAPLVAGALIYFPFGLYLAAGTRSAS